MNIKNILQLLAAGIVILAIGYGLGHFYAPEKVREVEKIVEKEKKTKQEDKKITERFDPNTGKVIERIEETKKKETETNTTKKETEIEKIKDKKMWAVKGGVAVAVKDPNKLVPRIGTEVRLPVFNSWLGAEGDFELANPKVGLYLRLEF
jgi:hypothetical protein